MGTPKGVGLGEIARELGVDTSTVSYWAKNGKVKVLKQPEGPGHPMILDRESVLAFYRERKKGDRRHRKTRGRGAPRRSPSRANSTQLVASPDPVAPPAQTNGAHPPPALTASWPTLALMEEFLSECRQRGLSALTVEDYEFKLVRFAKSVPALPCARADVVRHLDSIKLAPRTVQLHYRNLRVFRNWLVDVRGIDMPSIKGLSPKADSPATDPMTPVEARAFLDAAENDHDAAMFALMLATGMRTGELCSLERESIEADQVTVVGKTGRKVYPITPELGVWLKKLGRPFVFTRQGGKQISRSAVYHRVSRALRRAGVSKQKMGGHMLRHTTGYLSWARTGDLRYVQELLGHKTIAMTERYTKVSVEDVKRRYKDNNPLAIINESREPAVA